MEDEYTTVRITRKHQRLLSKLGVVGESIDDVIERLLKEKGANEE